MSASAEQLFAAARSDRRRVPRHRPPDPRRVNVRDGQAAPTFLVIGHRMGAQPTGEGAMSQQTTFRHEPTTWTGRLLACGIVAGPLFVSVWLIQALTREGFDPTYHPLSLLSLGDLGWIQIANFVLAGALYALCAAGMWRSLRSGPGGTWGPILVGANGIGLFLAGVFVTDAGAGFPPGAPAGAPEHVSWHAVLHEVGFVLSFASWTAACLVFRRRFAALERRGWVVACVAAPVAVLAISVWPDLDSLSLRLVIGSAISFGFVAALAARLMRGVPAGARGSLPDPHPTPSVDGESGVRVWTR
jgi:hypothetical protein